jgi:hypothetical protein
VEGSDFFDEINLQNHNDISINPFSDVIDCDWYEESDVNEESCFSVIKMTLRSIAKSFGIFT